MRVSRSKGSKRAVIYLRMSSNPQKDSIPQQREACLLYAADHGYEVVAEYADEAITGIASKLKRSGFQQLVEDAQAGKFEFVICWEQNRASRSKPREFFAEMDPIASAGVKLVFTNKGVVDLDKFTDFLTVACDANSANDYVLSMARSVVRGQHEKKATKGKWVGGTPPFAMDYIRTDPKKDPKAGDIVLGDPDDVETVRCVFRWYQEGFSHRGILEKMQSERGVKRTQNFVQRMLVNPFYVGDYRWNRKTRGRFFALRDGRITDDFKAGVNEESDTVYIPNNHPAIIDRETWTRVQHLVAERSTKTTPFRNGGVHLLTGLCRCARCGSGFSGSRHKGKNGNLDRLVLTCNGYRHGTCGANYVDQRDIVASVVASLDSVLSPEHVEKIREEYYANVADRREGNNAEALRRSLVKREAEYAELRGKIQKLPPDLLEDFTGDLRQHKAEIEKMRGDIAEAEAVDRDNSTPSVKFDSQLSTLTNIVADLKEAVADLVDTEPRLVREMLAALVESISLDVEPRKVSEKHTRYDLKSGEITLKPGFNLIASP
ncbi:hypothetical protein K227x_62120 [Rubripirellula lacrimiformis]|uniref:Recombinase n=1 Tax=Rubripirellula lacrimiformis TaxID=1930273 RepID=A0A517NKW6_9BACT|nr:recombinase family protein [Rubripirellula lacrimiformis]QDT07784.1 hypothetical protein K227x_62120 [Rubripirellula lacrimiformis]